MELQLDGVPSAENALKMIAEFGRQIPYASSVALNQLATEIRGDTITNLAPSRFIIRNKTFLTNRRTGFNVEYSHKTRLATRIYSNYEPWVLHEEGGMKKPRGRHLAIPQRENIGVDLAKIIPQGKRPKALLRRPRTFDQTMPSGKRGIWQRTSGERYPIKLLYAFSQLARIRKIFGFVQNGARLVSKKYQRIFGETLAKAIAEAKAKGWRLS